MTYSTVPSAAGKGLHWLLRYARHCKVKLDPHPPEGNALKSVLHAGRLALSVQN